MTSRFRTFFAESCRFSSPMELTIALLVAFSGNCAVVATSGRLALIQKGVLTHARHFVLATGRIGSRHCHTVGSSH